MPQTLDTAGLASLQDFGFTGGRDSFRIFCRNVFRDAQPRFLKDERDQLVVFRHRDLQAFGIAPEIGNVPIGKLYPNAMSSAAEPAEKTPGWAIKEVIGNQVFTYNPPLHGPARRILTDWLSPRQVALMEDLAREVAGNIIQAAAGIGEIEFVSLVADAFVVGFWSRLLHLTQDEQVSIGRCAHDMTRLFHVNRTGEDLAVLDRAFAEYARIIGIAADRGLARGDATMIELHEKIGRLPLEDDPLEAGTKPTSLGAALAGNLVDGFHTAALATANSFHALLTHKEAYAAVKDNPDLLPRAIAEALRLEPPVLLLSRYVMRDFHYEDFVVPAGQIISMLWAAGNHDPMVFDDPERFDLHRPHTGLTTFGKGVHICPGRYVGVMLVRILIEQCEAMGIIPELADAPVWYPAHKMNQLSSLPVRLMPHQRP